MRKRSCVHNADGTTTIPLTAGRSTIICTADWPLVAECNWFTATRKVSPYASANMGGRRVYLHRLLMDAPDGIQVDHINGNTLDNRRENLRLATCTENNRNMRLPKTNTSGYKGVSWYGRTQRWRATVRDGNGPRHIGYFPTPETAARAYDEAAIALHGDFARTNAILGLLHFATHKEAR